MSAAKDWRLVILLTVCTSAPGVAGAEFRRGDTNNDGRVSLADCLDLKDFVTMGGPEPECMVAGDVDADGMLGLHDVLHLFRFLFLGDEAPAAPYPACGVDPAPTQLSCDGQAMCDEPTAPLPGRFTLFVSTDPDTTEPPHVEPELRGPAGELVDVPFFAHIVRGPEGRSDDRAAAWSFALRLETESLDASLETVTIEETVTPHFMILPAANHTERVRGDLVVSAVMLSLIVPASIDVEESSPILRGTIRVRVPTESSGGSLTLRPVGGLRGSGEPVDLEVSWNGQAFVPQTSPLTLHVRPQGAVFIRGDANDDGIVDLSDAVFSLDYLFRGRRQPPCLDATDANDDGRLNISDAVFLLHSLFLAGDPPPPPHSECGSDPTADEIECDLRASHCV